MKRLGLIFLTAVIGLAVATTSFAMGKQENKKAIVLANFGTSYLSALKAITTIQDEVRKNFPNVKVKMAFTSNIIRSIWHKRRNDAAFMKEHGKELKEFLNIKGPLATIADLQDEGYRTIIVQPCHVYSGEEFMDLCSYVSGLNAIKTIKIKYMPFVKLVVGRPALGTFGPVYDYHKDLETAAKVLKDDVTLAKKEKAALVYMGHGNEFFSTGIYIEFQQVMRKMYPDVKIFIGTVEGFPSLEDVLTGLRHQKVRKVVLKPFMVGEPRIPSKEWRTIYSTILALIVGFVLFQSHSSILSIPYLFLTLVFLFYRSIHSSELLALFLGALGPVSIYNLGRRKLKNSFISLFFMGFGAITVGYTVNAILSDFNHITQLYTYRGVKLSLLLLPFLVFVREFFDEKSGFLRSGEKLKMIDIFVFSVILAGGVYYILRSGNYSFVLNAERKFRDTIESIFIVRPRFKEIIGYAFLFFTLRIRERGLIGRYHFIFPVLGSLGIVGTVNTFCHIKSPIFIDLYRSFLGIIIGYTLGYVLISILGMKNPRVWTRGS